MHYNAQDGGKWQFNDYGTSFTFHGNWTISTSKAELVASWKMERHFAFFSLFTTSVNFSVFYGFIFHFNLALIQNRPDFKCIMQGNNLCWKPQMEGTEPLLYLLHFNDFKYIQLNKVQTSLLQVRVAWHDKLPIPPATS